MKKRIVALILTVVTTLLVFTSCGSFNFAKEDLGAYASFDYAKFKEALANLVVEDSDFTADEATRIAKVKQNIYNTVADKMIAAATDSTKLEKGTLGEGDALYFVFYAVDANGNVFFSSEMQESAISGTNKANHVIRLGDVKDTNKFMTALKGALDANKVDVEDFIYSVLFADEIKNQAEKDFEAEWNAQENTPETTDDDQNVDGGNTEEGGNTEDNTQSAEDAKKEALAAYIQAALTVKEGDVIVVSYTRTYTDAEGNDVKETATYETLGTGVNAELYAKLFEEGVTAKVGSVVSVAAPTEEDANAVSNSFKLGDYTYENVTIKYQIENFKPMVEFKYTPYTTDTEIAADSVHVDGKKVPLKDVELTYYVFPLYYVEVPTYDALTSEQILAYVYGTSLKTTSFAELADESYKNGDVKVTDLVADIAKINSTDLTAHADFFAKYPELKAAVENYNKASSNTTYKNELAEQRLAVLLDYADKIAKCSNGTQTIGDIVKEDYYQSVYYSNATTYASEMTKKVEEAVWNVIDTQVVVNSYPKKLVKEFKKHLEDEYESTYYTGKAGAVAHVDAYKTFDDFLMQYVYKLPDMAAVDAAMTAEAEALIAPMIKIYVVAKACETDALRVLGNYVQADIDGGIYNTSATEKDNDSIEYVKSMSNYFLVNNKYLKAYKKAVGKENYKYYVQYYGETNLKIALQFDRLFYYLTATDVVYNADKNTTDVVVKDGKIAFRCELLSYTTK